MSKTFTTALTLSSTTLFPQTANVTANLTQVVSGSAGFDLLVVPQTSSKQLYKAAEADPSSTVYFYAQALSTNPTALTLAITGSDGNSSTIVRLRAGDMTYIPLNATSATLEVNCVNAATSSQNIYVFYGQRS